MNNDRQNQGQNGEGGRLNSDRNTGGAYNGGQMGAWNNRGPLTPEEVRQMQAELRQRVQDAENLARDLRGQGVDVTDLNNWIGRLRELQRNGEHFQNRELLANIQASIAAGFKDVEFGIRRKLEGESTDKLHLSGSEQLPPAYKKMVEEYFRSLSVKKK
jgi:hypothetical protein